MSDAAVGHLVVGAREMMPITPRDWADFQVLAWCLPGACHWIMDGGLGPWGGWLVWPCCGVAHACHLEAILGSSVWAAKGRAKEGGLVWSGLRRAEGDAHCHV